MTKQLDKEIGDYKKYLSGIIGYDWDFNSPIGKMEEAHEGGWDACNVPKNRWVFLEYEYNEKGCGYPCVGHYSPSGEYDWFILDPFHGPDHWPSSRISRWRDFPDV